MIKKLICIFLSAFAISGVFASNLPVGNGSEQVLIPSALVESINVDRYAGSLDIYRSGEVYYSQPYLVVDHKHLEHQLKQCQTQYNQPKNFSINFETSSVAVKNEILNELNNKLRSKGEKAATSLLAFPYQFLRLKVLYDSDNSGFFKEDTLGFYPTASSLQSLTARAVMTSSPTNFNRVNLKTSCENFEKIVKNGRFQIEINTPTTLSIADQVVYSVANLFEQDDIIDLTHAERQSGVVKTSSTQNTKFSKQEDGLYAGGLIRLNLSASGLDASASGSVTSEDSRIRLVNQAAIDVAARKLTRSITFTRVSDQGADGKVFDDIYQQIKTELDSNSKHMRVLIDNGMLKLKGTDDLLYERNLTNDERVFLSQPEGELNASFSSNDRSSGAVSAAGVGSAKSSSSNQSHTMFTDKRGVTYRQEGQKLIPVSISLYKVQEASVSNVTTGRYTNIQKVGKHFMQTWTVEEFKTPALPAHVDEIVDEVVKNLKDYVDEAVAPLPKHWTSVWVTIPVSPNTYERKDKAYAKKAAEHHCKKFSYKRLVDFKYHYVRTTEQGWVELRGLSNYDRGRNWDLTGLILDYVKCAM